MKKIITLITIAIVGSFYCERAAGAEPTKKIPVVGVPTPTNSSSSSSSEEDAPAHIPGHQSNELDNAQILKPSGDATITLQTITPVIAHLKKELLITKSKEIGIIPLDKKPTCFAFNNDFSKLVVGSNPKHLALYTLNGLEIKKVKKNTFNFPVFTVLLNKSGNRFAFTAPNYTSLWNSNDGTLIKGVNNKKGSIGCIAFSPNGKSLALGNEKNVILCNAESGEIIDTFAGHKGTVDGKNSITFSPDGKKIASCSTGITKNVIIWDIKTKTALKINELTKNSSKAIAFSPNGTKVAFSDFEKVVMYDLQQKKSIATYPFPKENNRHSPSIVFSPDGIECLVTTRNTTLHGRSNIVTITGFLFKSSDLTLIQSRPMENDSSIFIPNSSCIINGRTLYDAKNLNCLKRFSLSLNEYLSPFFCRSIFDKKNNNFFFSASHGIHKIKLWSEKDIKTLESMHTLDLSQAQLLYHLYIAKLSNNPITLDPTSTSAKTFATLPKNTKKLVTEFLLKKIVINPSRFEPELTGPEKITNDLDWTNVPKSFGENPSAAKEWIAKRTAPNDQKEWIAKRTALTYQIARPITIPLESGNIKKSTMLSNLFSSLRSWWWNKK